MGVLQQKAALENLVQAVRRTATASKAPKVCKLQRDSYTDQCLHLHNTLSTLYCLSMCRLSQVKGLTPATRHSQRLQKVDAEHTCLVESANDCSLRQGDHAFQK